MDSFLVQVIQFHIAQNRFTGVESVHVLFLSVFTSESLVNVSILTKANNRTHQDQVDVVAQNLDQVAAKNAGAGPHFGWIADDVAVRVQFQPQANMTEALSLAEHRRTAIVGIVSRRHWHYITKICHTDIAQLPLFLEQLHMKRYKTVE